MRLRDQFGVELIWRRNEDVIHGELAFDPR
jgi:hypothetical protein